MRRKLSIKKLVSSGIAISLALIVAVPSGSFLINEKNVKAELEPSAMGNFAVWYGQEYQRKQQEKEKNQGAGNQTEQNTFGMPALPPKGSYQEAIESDIANGLKTYGINKFADWTKQEIANYINKADLKDLKKLYADLPKQYHQSSIMTKNAYKTINQTQNQIQTKAAKVAKVTKNVGRCVNVVMAAKGLYDMYDQPDVGYKSPFLEFCANSVRGMSAVSNVILPEGSWAYGVVEGVVTSKTLVKFVNDRNFSAGPLDRWVDTFNKYYQSCFEDWFFGSEKKLIEENEKRIRLAKEYCQGASCNANGVNVYKPNIYLYPTEKQAVSVEFEMPELLTVTEPLYNGGWKVLASPDGKLKDLQSFTDKNGKQESEEYDYLFYESLTMPSGWQSDEGFVIPTENRKEVFTEILKAYGLNEKEIEDFNEFWCDKLDARKEYYMYPQLTEVIDERMPVDIKPAPDSILRIWFAFDEKNVPEKEPELTCIERVGFTVIEWGGFILN